MRSSSLTAASPRFGSFMAPASPFHTPHASPAFGPVTGSSHGVGAAYPYTISPLVTSLLNVMWFSDLKQRQHCSHIQGGGASCIDEDACLSTITKPDSWCCEACQTSNAIRMCLTCGSCACERHSYLHFEKQSSHALFMQLNAETKPVFCYDCRILVKDDNEEKNLTHLRAVLENVQTLNVDILSKTTRSGRKRGESTGASTNAFAAMAAAASSSSSSSSAAAPPVSTPSLTRHPHNNTISSKDEDVVMSDINPDSDELPPTELDLIRRQSLARVKSWHQAMPYLGKKAQLQRANEDQFRTVIFRWRNRALVRCFNSWKYVMRMERPNRLKRKAEAAAATGKRVTRSKSSEMDDISSMTLFNLDNIVPEGNEDDDGDAMMEDVVSVKKKKAGLISALPPLAPPTERRSLRGSVREISSPPAAAAQPSSPERRRPKRSRSEERHGPTGSGSTSASPRPPQKEQARDDLLATPKTGRRKGVSASARVSPNGSRSPSPSPRPLKSAAEIKLAPGIMGLRNLGNTCYLNSVLQALSLTSQFRSYYMDCIPKLLPPLKHNDAKLLNARAAKTAAAAKKKVAASSDSSDSEGDDEDDEEDYSSLSRDFSELLTTIWKGQRVQYTPDHFLQTVWTLYERFKGFKQQDAQEFVLFLLNQLSKEQEQQCTKQQLEPRFHHPHLQQAKQEIRQPTEKPAPPTATGSGVRKRKNVNNTSTPMEDDDAMGGSEDSKMDEQQTPANRRRSGRSSTIISTTSSLSLAASDASAAAALPTHAPALHSHTSRSSTYNTPLPPSTLASLELHHPKDVQPPSTIHVPRLIVAREHDFIVQNFSGVLRSEIKCTVCNRVSASESDYLGMISVQIPPKSFLCPEGEETATSSSTERHANIHHSSSQQVLAGGAAASGLNTTIGAPSTFLSVSRSLSQSRSEHTLSASLTPMSPSLTPTATTPHAKVIRHHGEATLQKCLSFTFNQPEVMDGQNAYQCGGCKKKVRAEKYQVIQAVPPEYLILHIGRTVYDMTTFSSKKDQTHISFPLTDLDLSPYLPPESRHPLNPYLYDLYAVVNHHGRGLNEGHFTVYGKSEEQDCWLLFNDARVNTVSEEKVQESQAYLLFYKRKQKPT